MLLKIPIDFISVITKLIVGLVEHEFQLRSEKKYKWYHKHLQDNRDSQQRQLCAKHRLESTNSISFAVAVRVPDGWRAPAGDLLARAPLPASPAPASLGQPGRPDVSPMASLDQSQLSAAHETPCAVVQFSPPNQDQLCFDISVMRLLGHPWLPS